MRKFFKQNLVIVGLVLFCLFITAACNQDMNGSVSGFEQDTSYRCGEVTFNFTSEKNEEGQWIVKASQPIKETSAPNAEKGEVIGTYKIEKDVIIVDLANKRVVEDELPHFKIKDNETLLYIDGDTKIECKKI